MGRQKTQENRGAGRQEVDKQAASNTGGRVERRLADDRGAGGKEADKQEACNRGGWADRRTDRKLEGRADRK